MKKQTLVGQHSKINSRFTAAIRLCVLAFCLLAWTSAHAKSLVCKYKGDEVDLDDADVKAFIEGEVTCVRTYSDGQTATERKVLSKGKVLEEEVIGKNRHELRRYKIINGNNLRHGEQLEYYPGTKAVKIRERNVDGHKVGLQESFFENGKIKEKAFYAKVEGSSGAPSEVANIRFTPSGKIAYLRCSENKETTIDPTLCGFMGPKDNEYYYDNEKLRAKVRLQNGKVLESEEEAATNSRWASVLQTGTVDEPSAVKRKKENKPDGSSIFTDLYENGKVKRRMEIDSRGNLTGKDEEWYESGQMARSTTYGRTKANSPMNKDGDLTVEQSSCWWQNGKPKIEVSRNKVTSTFEIKAYWDNGTLQSKGTVRSRTGCGYCMGLPAVEFLIQCESGYGYGFKNEGVHYEWDQDGQPSSEVTYSDGQRHGIEKIFARPKGAPTSYLAEERTYAKGKVSKLIRYEDGKPVSTEEYFPDGSKK